ncbi:hypothetical protein ACHQM5_016428 [Ranunculus cassubicifolius]
MSLLQSTFLPSITLSSTFPFKTPSKITLNPQVYTETTSSKSVNLQDTNIHSNAIHQSFVTWKNTAEIQTQNGVEDYLSLLNRVNVNRKTHVLDSKKIHAQVVKSGLESNVVIGNKLSISYSKSLSSLDDARKLFDKITQRNIPAYAVLIGSYGRSQRWEDVICLSVMMVHEGFVVDKFIVPTVLKACSALERLRFGKMVHGYVVRNKLELDVFVGNGLVDMYANCGDLCCSRRMFDQMKERDVVSWTALVSAYMDAGDMDEAQELFDLMRVNGVKPDVISWNALISGFAHNGEIGEALGLLEEMRETGLKPEVNSWNGIISGCVRNEYSEEALDVYLKMLGSCEDPNAVTFACILPACGALTDLRLGMGLHACALKRDLCGNSYVRGSLVDMYIKCGRRDLAERSFMEMDVKNTAVINEMIMAYVNEDNMMEASKLLNLMPTDGLKPDVITYNTMLGGFARKGEMEEAYKLLSDMIQIGLMPNAVSMNVLISGFQQSGLSVEALKLFRIMQSPSEINSILNCQVTSLSIRPNSVNSTSALAACADLNSLCRGKEIHGYILRNQLSPNIFVSSALVDMYSKCHDMHSALKIFNVIQDKNTVSWNILMAGLINNTEKEEALRVFSRMMEDGLKPSSITLMILLSACCNVGYLSHGRELHSVILKSGFSEGKAALSCALINMYAKCGSITEARMVFDCEVNKDMALWNAIISGYLIHGLGEEAIKVFEQLESSDVEPDHLTFATILSAYAREGMLEQVKKYLDRIDTSGILPNLEHYVCMVNIMGNASVVKQALAFIERNATSS